MSKQEYYKKSGLPHWFVYVPRIYLLMVLVSIAHFLEHILQVVQKYVWGTPPHGLIGEIAEREWLHVVYNAPIYFGLLFTYLLIKKRVADVGRIDPGLSWLVIWLWVQGYHVLEHIAKIGQFLATGVEPAPGILGNWIDLVLLHFTLVLATLILMMPVSFKSRLLGYAKIVPVDPGA